MRAEIRASLSRIQVLLPWEGQVLERAAGWVDSGAPLIRRLKPGTPSPHLVCYSAVVDGPWILLVAHRSAGRWLPNGGHVDAGEAPVQAARRELQEELGLALDLAWPDPVLLTWTDTIGAGPSHTDVSLWFAFSGNREAALHFDGSEFGEARWFHRDALPERTDPHLGDFLAKLQVLSKPNA